MKRNILVVFILIFYCLTIWIITIALFAGISGETSIWLTNILTLCVYIFIGIFILTRGDSLNEYNIDAPSLVIFILGGITFRFEPAINAYVEFLFKYGIWVISGLIVIRILQRKIRLARPTLSDTIWVSLGLAAGILLAIPLAYLITHVGGYNAGPVDISQYTALNYIAKSFAKFSFSDIPQEFIFRGLFLGYLKKMNNDYKAYLIQGLFFWLYHFNTFLSAPLAFWIHLPLGTFLNSLLAWRSRSLAPSIAAHTAYNTFYQIFSILLSSR